MQLIQGITIHPNGLNGYREDIFPLLCVTGKFQLQWKSIQRENENLYYYGLGKLEATRIILKRQKK